MSAAITRDTTSKYARYCAAVAQARLDHPEWRRGQAHFNVLVRSEFDPKFGDSIRGFDLDPFYDDGMVPHLLGGKVARPVSSAATTPRFKYLACGCFVTWEDGRWVTLVRCVER